MPKIKSNILKPSQIKIPKHYDFHFIYKTTRFDGAFYIGVHSTNDKDDTYMGSGTKIRRSIKKHGTAQHTREILEFLPTREAAFEREKELISKEILADPACMNLMIGGSGSIDRIYGFTERTREKISENSKKMWEIKKAEGYVKPKQPAESVEKMAAKNRGKTRTEEQKQNIKDGQKKYLDNANKEELSLRGQKSAATRKERGTALGGRPVGIPMPEEQKLRQSLATRGKKLGPKSQETKDKISAALKKRHADTNNRAPTARILAIEQPPLCINQCCVQVNLRRGILGAQYSPVMHFALQRSL